MGKLDQPTVRFAFCSMEPSSISSQQDAASRTTPIDRLNINTLAVLWHRAIEGGEKIQNRKWQSLVVENRAGVRAFVLMFE